jgi:hypothetical protein
MDFHVVYKCLVWWVPSNQPSNYHLPNVQNRCLSIFEYVGICEVQEKLSQQADWWWTSSFIHWVGKDCLDSILDVLHYEKLSMEDKNYGILFALKNDGNRAYSSDDD